MINTILYTLFGAALGILGWAEFVQWEVRRNADLIKANGAADDLKHGFHARRTWIRFWWWLGCTVTGCLPPLLWGGVRGDGLALLFAGLGILLAGYFMRTFNPQLNVAMGLDYKARFYVSPSPTAARWPDQYVWQRLRQSEAEPTQENANFILQHYLNIVLGLSILLFLALAAGAVVVASRG
jgi:hypothetical protein